MALSAMAALVRRGGWAPVARYTVDGPSMEPAYRPGDRLLVNRLAYVRRAPRIGDVIVLRDPLDRRRLLLKRVAREPDAVGRIYVLGDNADESRDSRHFDAVERSLIVGKAWRKY
jgi:nickel-type superoxide dismutase maturation protease